MCSGRGCWQGAGAWEQYHDSHPGGVLPMWWVIHMCRGFDPLFSLWQDRARSFWGVFSHPPTQKQSFGYKSSQNSIFLAPKYHFSLDLFGSNFQWPAAHPQQFSDRVPPPGIVSRVVSSMACIFQSPWSCQVCICCSGGVPSGLGIIQGGGGRVLVSLPAAQVPIAALYCARDIPIVIVYLWSSGLTPNPGLKPVPGLLFTH